MADIEKVIRSIDRCVIKRGKCHKCDYYTQTDQEMSCRNKLLKDALELLKKQQPRVLSYKEVMESDFVFIELYTDENDGVEPEFIRAIPLFISYSQPSFVTQYEDCNYGFYDEYMYTWRCWTARPTDEQRKAVPWKVGEKE